MKLTKKFIAQLKNDPLPTLRTLSEDDIASILQQANHSYYNTTTPLFSDTLFDMIKEYLEAINPSHPVLKHVGSIVDSGKKEVLPFYVGSLDKIKSDTNSVDKFKKQFKESYVVSDKLDGNSALLCVNKGHINLYSRGDGTTGQNISYLIPFLTSIPTLQSNSSFAVRGELIIAKKVFDEKLKDKGANARNMVAGIINAKIPDLEIARELQFIAYEVISPTLAPENQLHFLNELNFKTVNYEVVKENNLSIEKLSDYLIQRRNESEFEIDGLVVVHNAVHKRIVGKNPKHAFAFKSLITMQKVEVTVSHVEWNLSKDGYLIPVVNFNPVVLAGVTIQRAHGFNGKFINDNKIGPGSKIIIMRSGDVIPYITSIISASENTEPQMPDVKYVWSSSGVDIMMDDVDKQTSDELKLKQLIYFFEKIDVHGLSAGHVKKMFAAGFTNVKSIFNITVDDLLKIEGYKKKMAEKLSAAIKERKTKLDCVNVMNASNTIGRGFGEKKLQMIVETYPNIIQSRYIPSLQELLQIKGIEKKTATLFLNNLPKYFGFIDDNSIICNFNEQKQDITTAITPLQGKKIVFTGFRDENLEKQIVAKGGIVTNSVSKSTYLVIRKYKSEKDSSKITKAIEYGVKIIEYEEFVKEFAIAN